VQTSLKNAPAIRADSIRLAQVFDNLFDNASKYAPNSPIFITMRPRDNYIQVLFTDHGPGIPLEHMPFLFERFYRVPESNSKRGTGLGLFICREIVRAHGGSMFIEASAPGKGTSFCMEFPLIDPKGDKK
jgi:signal transduction histidine kinase